MSYKLFLDDERNPQQVKWVELPLGPWTIVRSYDEFVKHITAHGMPAFVTFDHDLAGEHYPRLGTNGSVVNLTDIDYNSFKEKTGYDCAKWLCEYCMDNNLPFPPYQVHSMNPTGKENIISYIESFKRVHQ